jgi:hypothetical protein
MDGLALVKKEIVETSQPKKSDPTPFQKFDALARRIIKVPKAEIERRAAQAKSIRAKKREAQR